MSKYLELRAIYKFKSLLSSLYIKKKTRKYIFMIKLKGGKLQNFMYICNLEK